VSSDTPQQYEDYLAIGDTPKWFSSTFTRITNASGEVIGVQVASLDISARKQAEEALSESQALLKAAFETSQAGIVIVDAPSGKLRYVNKAGLLIRNKAEEDIQKDNDKLSYIKRWNLFHLDGTPYAEEEFILARAFLFGETRSDEFIIQRDDLENRYVLAHAAPIRNPMGIISAGVIVFLDITDKKKAEEEINFLAYHDHLTNVNNRRFFEDEFVRMNAEANFPLAIITGDLNGLKLINDSIGHAAGDQAIRLFADAIREQLRICDVLSRIGGDEFGIILPKYSDEEAKAMVSRMQSIIRIKLNDSKSAQTQIELSATFGYSVQSFIGQTLDSLMNEAETFMYRRKFYDDTSKHSHVIDAIMNMLFEKSVREQQHSLRVSMLSSAIAEAMHLDETTVAKVKAAGALHDIGKIGIDERILNKTDSLTDIEWNLMKQHPIRSARILATIDAYLDIVPFVKSHHERYDGLGYPAGLSSTQIPLEARIISVADAYDAMTKSRPYRAPINKDAAAEELLRCAGSHFDPHIVEVFIQSVLPGIDILAGVN
jgi:diguanylate cyclase (GGDEF)-like protein/putative nucleotidyltransferase with HDIG domain